MNKNKFPVFSKSAKCEYDCGNGVKMQVYTGNVTNEDFVLYNEEVGFAGFIPYDTQLCGTLVQYTYKVEEGIIYVAFDKSIGIMCLIKDNFTKLYKTEDLCKKTCQTVLYQFEVDHSLIDCGMCYIVQCCDGSFFIIDSAHTYSINDNDRLHDFLKARTPKGNRIKISGWFFSHGHVDHIGKFCDYLKYNCEDTDIEALYYNFVPNTHKDNIYWMDSDKAFTDNFCKLVEKSDIPIVKLHSGQRFHIRNLMFDVLCTHEDVYSSSLKNYNDSSTVLMMYAEGSRVLFPGDAGGVESEILERRVGEGLRCDIVQVAHHGHFGTSEKFYELANADVALFATTQIKYDEELPNYAANRKAVELCNEHHIASNGTVEIALPYKRGGVKVLPDETFEDFNGIYGLWGYEYTDERKQQLRTEFEKRSKM